MWIQIIQGVQNENFEKERLNKCKSEKPVLDLVHSMVFTNMIQWLLYTRFVHFVHKTIFSNSNSILDNNPDFSECTSVSAKKKRKMLRSQDFGYFFSKDRDSSIQRGKIKLISETSLYLNS